MAKVHIIGAGLAGLAAAVKLIKAGYDIELYESTPQAGGRCRSYYDNRLERVIDNGNHVILGANSYALAYIKEIGAEKSFKTVHHSQYIFIDLLSGKRRKISPLWLLRSLPRLAFATEFQTVAECFDSSSVLYREFIYPFCISALNTEPDDASARTLKRTLLHILLSGRKGLQSYHPKYSLSESLINPALRLIEAKGSKAHYLRRLKQLEWADNHVTAIQFNDHTVSVPDDYVILATNPYATATLMPELDIADRYNAIVNGHFLCPDLIWPEKSNFIGITGGTVQWIFYRNGILSTTTSAANDLVLKDNRQIAEQLWDDVQKALKLTLPLPVHRIICEKQATHPVKPGSKAKTAYNAGNLIIAGDYTVAELPNSIETAVRSGLLAAERILRLYPPVAHKPA
jgi:uncharacterized protein with NAD-binding domain and iron-sulfur cluster